MVAGRLTCELPSNLPVQQPCSNASFQGSFEGANGVLLQGRQHVRVEVSRVIAIDECPNILQTIFELTLRERSNAAQVYRRSWKRMSDSPARSSSGLTERFLSTSAR